MANIEITDKFLPVQVGSNFGTDIFGNLFDGLTSPYYTGQAFPSGGEFQYTPYTRILTRITLRNRITAYSIKSFTLYGSTTGAFAGEESTLLTVTDTAQLSDDEERSWDIIGASAFRYFFIDITAGYNATYVSMEWMKVYADDGEVLESPITGTFGSNIANTATITAQNNSATAASNLPDGNTATIWFGGGTTASEWIEAYWAVAKRINKIFYQARDDGAFTQAPLRIILEASNTGAFAGEEIELFDTGVFEVFWVQAKILTYEFINATTYNYYRYYVSDAAFKSACEIGLFEGSDSTVVETPVITPTSGAYPASQSISMSCATSGADIYYTTDGSTPDSGDNLYSTPFALTSAKTVKAIGIKSGLTDSDIASETYTIAVAASQPIIIIMT